MDRFPSALRVRTVRDPLWHNIRLDRVAARVVDTPEFQRLRYVKQLGFAHLVYPGAVHSRFLHAIGVYHLTARAIEGLRSADVLSRLREEDLHRLPLVRLAALLHDVGHYAFSHAMEEVGPESIPGHHEEMAGRFLGAGPIRRALEEVGPEAPERIGELIRGASTHPLQGLVAGSLDLDKIDYLARDSFFCGVPYGSVDVDRLLDALTLAAETDDGPLEVAVSEKGIAALESLLFSKYQMFRNVYWHHAVRAATTAFRRLIETALAVGLLARQELPGRTDEELMHLLAERAQGPEGATRSVGGTDAPAGHGDLPGVASGGDDRLALVRVLLEALEQRRLPKRIVELFGDRLPDGIGTWTSRRPDLVRRLEERLAEEWKLAPGSVFVDYPSYPGMLELRILLVRRDGEVQRLTPAGEKGLIDLPRLGRSLHHAARVFRVFSLDRSEPREPGPLLDLLGATAEEAEGRLAEARPLY